MLDLKHNLKSEFKAVVTSLKIALHVSVHYVAVPCVHAHTYESSTEMSDQEALP